MSVPTAKEMAAALRSIGRVLYQERVIENEHVLHQVATSVQRCGSSSCKWTYEISASSPLKFMPVLSKELDRRIRPQIYARISVVKLPNDGVCFSRLDLHLEVLDDEGTVLIKHHVDLANHPESGFQPGPLFHLQFGGHTPKSSRALEVTIKQPRWLCMPLDLVLLCEVVVANFYPEEWEIMKQQPNWNATILSSQDMCIAPFARVLQQKLNLSCNSVLDHLWATNAGPGYVRDGF